MSMSKFMYCQKTWISPSYISPKGTLLDVLVIWFTTCQHIRISIYVRTLKQY